MSIIHVPGFTKDSSIMESTGSIIIPTKIIAIININPLKIPRLNFTGSIGVHLVAVTSAVFLS